MTKLVFFLIAIQSPVLFADVVPSSYVCSQFVRVDAVAEGGPSSNRGSAGAQSNYYEEIIVGRGTGDRAMIYVTKRKESERTGKLSYKFESTFRDESVTTSEGFQESTAYSGWTPTNDEVVLRITKLPNGRLQGKVEGLGSPSEPSRIAPRNQMTCESKESAKYRR